MWRGGFLLGEAQAATPEGESVFRAYAEEGGRFWTALTTLRGLSGHLRALRAGL